IQKGLVKFCKDNEIKLEMNEMSDNARIDYNNMEITINRNLSIDDKYETIIDSLSHLLVKLENLDSRSNYAKRYERNLNNSLRDNIGLKPKNNKEKYSNSLTTKQTKKIVYSSSKYSNKLQSAINLEARRQKTINVNMNEVR
ncbi:MAG: hypothetical protein ACK5G7_03035, partial [Erysipelotrichaceae bacterium]